MNLLQSRLIVVTGKGGVGRTTTSVALGLAAARAGRRTAVVELYGMGSAPLLMGLSGRSYAPRQLAPGLDCISLTPQECMSEYGRRKLKLGALSRMLFGNRTLGAFIEAVPGFHDLLQLGKIEYMLLQAKGDEPHYDLVIVDAPATGHGLTFLATTRSMMDMTRVGPFYELAANIHALLGDAERTSLALVALPEELPVNESLELVEALGSERSQLRALVLNQVRQLPPALQQSWSPLRQALTGSPSADLQALARLGDQLALRAQSQRQASARLQEGTRELTGRVVPLARLPRMEVPRLERQHVLQLGASLSDQVESP